MKEITEDIIGVKTKNKYYACDPKNYKKHKNLKT